MKRFILTLTLGACAVSFAASAGWAAMIVYSEDFEALDASNPGALGAFGAGFGVYADVWDGPVETGTFLYNYGVFSAPNGGPGFSGIGLGEGGPEQGLQYLNVYSDYNNPDHGLGGSCAPNSCTINTSVLRDLKDLTNPITAADIGSRWIFTGDYKAPFIDGIAEPGTSAMANAYLVTLDPMNNYSLTNDLRFDTTAASNTDWASFSLSIDLTDPALIGQILQIGFNTRATNYEASGVYYDNLEVSVSAVTDPPPEPPANQLVTNGGFETGDLSGWTASTNGFGDCDTDWNVSAVGGSSATGCGGGGIFGMTNPGAPTEGVFAAYNSFDGDGPQAFSLSQSILVPTDIVSGTLSWFESGGIDYFDPDPAARIWDVSLGGTSILNTAFATNQGFPDYDIPWTAMGVDVSSILAANSGSAIDLVFSNLIPEFFSGPAGWGLDGVRLDVAVGLSEPGTLLLFFFGLLVAIRLRPQSA